MKATSRLASHLWTNILKWPIHCYTSFSSEGLFTSLLSCASLATQLLRTGFSVKPVASPPCFIQPELTEGKGSGFWHPGDYWGLLTKQQHFSSVQRELFLESEVWHLKAEYNMLSDQRKAFSNFYLYLLLLFVNIQYPDFSLILLPAFLAISLLSLLPAVPPIAFLLLLLFSSFPPICNPYLNSISWSFVSGARKNCFPNSQAQFYNTFSLIYLQVPLERGGPAPCSLELHIPTTSVVSDLTRSQLPTCSLIQQK